MAWLLLRHRRIQKISIDADIEQFGPGTLLRFAHTNLLHGDPTANLAAGVVKIPGEYRLGRADNFASWFETHFDPGSVEIAFRGGVAVGINIQRIVGTGLHAGFAANAAFVIEIDNAIRPSEQGHRGTNFNARRIVAMIAAQHREVAAGIGITAFFNVLYPRPIYPDGDVVLFFTSDGTGVTADAAVLIDQESVTHREPFLNN